MDAKTAPPKVKVKIDRECQECGGELRKTYWRPVGRTLLPKGLGSGYTAEWECKKCHVVNYVISTVWFVQDFS